MAFTPIGDALDGKIKNDPALKNTLEAVDVVEVSEQIFLDRFGESESVYVKPLFLKNRTLTVTCTSSSIAQEIRLNQADIVKEINEKVGSKEVDRIRYLS